MDLVEEEDRALAPFPESTAGVVDCLTDIANSSGHRRELDECPSGGTGDGQGQSGLAGTGRPPEDHTRQTIGLHQTSKRSTGPDQVRLTDDIVDRTGSQTGREWRLLAQAILGGGREEIG